MERRGKGVIYRWIGIFLLCASSAQAGEGAWQGHGFVSHAVVYADRHNMGSAQAGQWGNFLSEAGANVSWRADADWLVSAQVLSRWDGLLQGAPRWDVAAVERMLFNRDGQQLAVQAGILKNPYGFYNTTRDVAHTRPGIALPSVYHEQSRNFFLSAPAVAVRGHHQGEQGQLSWQINVLQPDVNNRNLVMFLVGPQQSGQFQGRRSWLGQVLWENQDWRAAWSFANMAMHYQPVATDFFGAGRFSGAGNLTLRSNMLSVERNLEKWSYTLEYAQVRVLRDNFNVPGAAFLDQHATLEQGYVQGLWRVRRDWQLWLRHDVMYVDNRDRNGLVFASLTGMSPTQRYAHTWSVGSRYQPTLAWELSAELHHTNGSANLALYNNPPAMHRSQWNMLAVQAAYHF